LGLADKVGPVFDGNVYYSHGHKRRLKNRFHPHFTDDYQNLNSTSPNPSQWEQRLYYEILTAPPSAPTGPTLGRRGDLVSPCGRASTASVRNDSILHLSGDCNESLFYVNVLLCGCLEERDAVLLRQGLALCGGDDLIHHSINKITRKIIK
jgi:hypothetical protein